MSWHFRAGPRLKQQFNDGNSGKFRTSKGSFGYGRPPVPPESKEFPPWMLEALSKLPPW